MAMGFGDGCLIVQIKLSGQKVALLSRHHRRGNGNDTGLEFLRQSGFELTFGMRLDGNLDTAKFQLQLRILDWTAIAKAIEIKRDLLAIDHADQFEQLGHGRETWQSRSTGGDRGIAVIMTFACPCRGHG